MESIMAPQRGFFQSLVIGLVIGIVVGLDNDFLPWIQIQDPMTLVGYGIEILGKLIRIQTFPLSP